MANTYSQIYIHIIFSVKNRNNFIRKEYREELHKYITGIISNKNQKLLEINCMSDHLHILIELKPDQALSDLVRDIKSNSSKFINERRWIKGKFQWQEGFGAFSYSHSHFKTVANYIKNQEKHHSVRSFKDEYIKFLKLFNIDFDEKYIFDSDENN